MAPDNRIARFLSKKPMPPLAFTTGRHNMRSSVLESGTLCGSLTGNVARRAADLVSSPPGVWRVPVTVGDRAFARKHLASPAAPVALHCVRRTPGKDRSPSYEQPEIPKAPTVIDRSRILESCDRSGLGCSRRRRPCRVRLLKLLGWDPSGRSRAFDQVRYRSHRDRSGLSPQRRPRGSSSAPQVACHRERARGRHR